MKHQTTSQKNSRPASFGGAALLALSLAVATPATAQNEAPTNPPPASGQAISRVEAAQQAQAETLQKLLDRIGQLEKQGAEQKAAAQALQKAYDEQREAHAEQEQKLQGKITELEGKAGSLAGSGTAQPAADAPTPQALQQQIRIIERKNELAAEAADAKAKTSPKLTVGAGGFAFSSADTNFVLKIKGLIQTDYRAFFDNNALLDGHNSFLLRRARPIIEGTVFKDFDFQFVPDFGGSSVSIYDAWLNYKYRPELQLKAGRFKGPVGLENLQADASSSFNERGFPSSLVASRNIGIQLWGDLADGVASYAAGVFNNAGDARNPNNNDFIDNKEVAGRLFFQPFKQTDISVLQGLGFGVGASFSQINGNALALPNTTGGTLSGYTTSGQQQFFAYNPAAGTVVGDGAHWRLAPQATYYYGPFGLLGEYTISEQGVKNGVRKADLHNTAWQVSAQWVLTGEAATFASLTPAHPFDLHNGQWGAWQLVARYGQLNLDGKAFPFFSDPTLSAHEAAGWAVGINWWLNKNIRILTSFAHTDFSGGGTFNPAVARTLTAPATVTHQNEDVVFTRIQLAF